MHGTARFGIALLCAAASASCASTKGQTCDYVFFAPMNCVPNEKPRVVAQVASIAPIAPAHVPSLEPVRPVATEPVQSPAATPTPTTPEPASPPAVNAVYFDVGKDALTDGSKVTLNSIAEFLHTTKEHIKLAAYTDPTGKLAINKALAGKRANAVIAALVAAGVDNAQISIIPVDVATSKVLPPNEYWRLRKVVMFYSPETMARIEAAEAQDDEHAEKDIQPDVTRKEKHHKVRVAAKEGQKEPAEEKEDDVGGVPDKTKLETVDVIYWRSINHALFILAKQLGYFEQEGYNVRLHESKLEANELAIKLADSVGVIKSVRPNSAMDVKNRHYFLGAVCPYGFHEAIAKKLPFVSIGGMLTITSTMLMKKELYDAVHRDIRNFRGAIGRVNLLANEFDHAYLFTDRLRQAGLKEGVDFKLVVYKDYSALYDALFRGEIVTAKADPPDDLELIKRHPEFMLYPLAALNLNLPCCRQVVTRENLRKNRGKYIRFERAVIRAQRYLIEHPTESITILAKFLGMTPGTARSFLQRTGFSLTANPNVKGAQAMADSMKGRLGAGMVGDIREATDTSVFEEALASLLKEEPENPALHSMLAVYNRTK